MMATKNINIFNERVTLLDNHMRDVCNQLACYARKIAKVRDEGDHLAQCIWKFAENETINTSLRMALINYADYLTAVQDFRDYQLDQLENRLINEMSVYGDLCKKAKEEIRKGLANISKPKKMLRTSSMSEIPNVTKAFELQIDRFEQKKLFDLKRYFCELAKIELFFHTKSLEMFTGAYQEMNKMDDKSDLNSFRKHFGITIYDKSDKIKSKNMLNSLRRFSSTPEIAKKDKITIDEMNSG